VTYPLSGMLAEQLISFSVSGLQRLFVIDATLLVSSKVSVKMNSSVVGGLLTSVSIEHAKVTKLISLLIISHSTIAIIEKNQTLMSKYFNKPYPTQALPCSLAACLRKAE
jgi:hypothetical protein